MNIRNFITKGLKLTALMLASILFVGMILPVAAESTQVKQKSNKQLAVDIAAEGTVLLAGAAVVAIARKKTEITRRLLDNRA